MIFIFLMALILFGPKKLPEIAREIGKFMAEFKRASNDFTAQLQNEIEKAGADATPAGQSGGQQTSTFTQTLLPPAVTTAISEIDGARERLMQTARMAFDAQNFTLNQPQSPVVASLDTTSTAASGTAPDSVPVADSSTPPAPDNAYAVYNQTSPVEAATDHPVPESAQSKSDSASQSS